MQQMPLQQKPEIIINSWLSNFLYKDTRVEKTNAKRTSW